MKVSIKNLHITFMGNDEPKVTTAPAEFYSQYERELRQELEKSRSEGVHVSDQLANVRRSAEAMDAELKLIAAWVKGYDEGEWPDHNAKGLGHVSGEVLHMIRDFQADIESRPLNVGIGRWVDTPPSPAQPSEPVNPVGVGQPEPETVQTQTAAPESAPVKAATAYIDAQAKECPGKGCSTLLIDGQEYCAGNYCNRRFSGAINTSDAPVNVRPVGDMASSTLKATRFAEIYVAPPTTRGVATSDEPKDNEAKTAEQKALSALLPPCKHAGCDEPTQPGRNFCQEHRKPAKR